MQSNLRGRDMVSTQDWSKDEIDTIMEVALDLKRSRAMGRDHAYLRDKVLAMLFFFSSTRTRSSFESGIAQLGGTRGLHRPVRPPKLATVTPPKRLAKSTGATTTASPLGNVIGELWQSIHQRCRRCQPRYRSSICSARCTTPSKFWPTLMTIIEKKGDPRGKTIAVSYAYASSYQKPLSVPQSLILLMTRYGMNVRLVHPPEFKLMPDIVQQSSMTNASRTQR